MSVLEGHRPFLHSMSGRCVCAVMFFLAAMCRVVPGVETSDPNRADRFRGDGDAEAKRGPVEIYTGFVIGDQGYISPPYVVRSEDEVIYVNDQAVFAWPWGRRFRRPPSRQREDSRDDEDRPSSDAQDAPSREGQDGPAGEETENRSPGRDGGPSSFFRGRAPRGMPMGRQVARIERHLRGDGMIICAEGAPAGLVSLRQAIDVLDVLVSRRTSDQKVQALMDLNVAWMASEQWRTLVDAFSPSEELMIRLQKARDHCARLDSERAEAEHKYLRLHSIVTILGFLLAVWAFGSLFACRTPIADGASSGDASGISPRQVVRLIVLIAVLSAYDLLCTLFADGLGGLWELNPLAGSLLSSRISIVVFKVLLTAGACTLLAYARHHRFAQQAAWWSGVLYTMLILRWATFNSVFMPG